MYRFLGELAFHIEGKQLDIRLDFNALRLWAEKSECEFNEVTERLQSGDFNQICEFLWHGHRSFCHRNGSIPQIERNEFMALVCGQDPEELGEAVTNALALGNNEVEATA